MLFLFYSVIIVIEKAVIFMSDSPLIIKSKEFALQIIKVCNYVKQTKKRKRINEPAFTQRNKCWCKHSRSFLRSRNGRFYCQTSNRTQRVLILCDFVAQSQSPKGVSFWDFNFYLFTIHSLLKTAFRPWK